jgi:hypothetical protein
MVYVDLAQLLTLGEQTGLTSSARFRAILGDLDKVRAIGLSSTRAPGETTATLSVRVPSG